MVKPRIVLLIYSNYLSTLQLWAGVIPRVDIQNGQAQDRVTDFCTVIIYLHYSYEPELFPGLIYRMVQPRIVLLIYSNYLSTLQLWAGVIPRVDIQNGQAQDRVTDFCTVIIYLHYSYEPELLVQGWYTVIIYLHYSYEPELFPGLIYRIVMPRIVLLIFVQ